MELENPHFRLSTPEDRSIQKVTASQSLPEYSQGVLIIPDGNKSQKDKRI